jgi:hypothetical protein
VTDDTNYLLEAIERLTIPHKSHVVQSKNGISCVSEVQHRPLLLLLRDAVAGGTSGHAPSAQSREKIPVNPAALELWDSIVTQINAWYLALPEPNEHLYIHTRLGRWYLDFENRRRRGTINSDDEHLTEKLLQGWAHTIEAMFDPPTTRELVDSECPECGISWPIIITNSGIQNPRTKRKWYDSQRVVGLVVYYRPDGEGGLRSTYASCRCCGAIWNGSSGVRALAYELERPDIYADLVVAVENGELDTPHAAAA